MKELSPLTHHELIERTNTGNLVFLVKTQRIQTEYKQQQFSVHELLKALFI